MRSEQGTTARAALRFGLGLAAAGALYGFATIQFASLDLGPIVGTLPLVIGGAVGGVALARGNRRCVSAAAASAIALGSGFLVTGALYQFLLQFGRPDELGLLAVFLVRFALIGAWLGALLSVVREDWRSLPRLAAAGAAGFGLGALFLDRVSQLLFRPIEYALPGWVGDPLHDGLALALTWAIAFAIAGVLGGAAMGYTLENGRFPLPLLRYRPARKDAQPA